MDLVRESVDEYFLASTQIPVQEEVLGLFLSPVICDKWINADLVTHIAPRARFEMPPVKPSKDLQQAKLLVSICLVGTHFVAYLLDQQR